MTLEVPVSHTLPPAENSSWNGMKSRGSEHPGIGIQVTMCKVARTVGMGRGLRWHELGSDGFLRDSMDATCYQIKGGAPRIRYLPRNRDLYKRVDYICTRRHAQHGVIRSDKDKMVSPCIMGGGGASTHKYVD